MKIKKQLAMILKDPKHWIGWGLTTGAIIGLYHLLGIHAVHSSIWQILALFGTIITIDSIKHITKLQ